MISSNIKNLHFFSPIAVALCLTILQGCKPEIERAMVTGAVTYDDKPVSRGQVRFVPIGKTRGPSWTAWIRDGKYTTEGSKGTPVGELKVEIFAYRPIPGAQQIVPGPDEDVAPGFPQEQFIPAKFNLESELKMSIPSGAGKVEQNFALKAK